MRHAKGWSLSFKRIAVLGVAMFAGLAATVNSATAQIADKYADRAKVIEFAVKNMGQRIGRGECTDLVNAALTHAGAKQLVKRPKSTVEKMLEEKTGAKFPDEIYVWGIGARTLGKGLNKMRVRYEPGQIIQFEGCRFEKPDGSGWWEMPHHSAIVKSANGSVVTLLHQNAPIGSGVSELTLDMNWLVPPRTGVTHGRIKAYYPQKQ